MVVVELVNDGVDHDGLLVDGQDRVRGDCNPVVYRSSVSHPQTGKAEITLTSFKGQGFTGNEHDICPFIPPLHPELPISTLLLPTCPRREVETRRLVRLAAHVPRAHNTMPIRNGKIQQTPCVDPHLPFLRHLSNESVDPLNGSQQRSPQHRMPKTTQSRICTRIDPLSALQQMQEQRKRPLAVRSALHAEEPALPERRSQRTLDEPPRANATVVHEHKRTVPEGMTVGVGQRALGGGAHMRED